MIEGLRSRLYLWNYLMGPFDNGAGAAVADTERQLPATHHLYDVGDGGSICSAELVDCLPSIAAVDGTTAWG